MIDPAGTPTVAELMALLAANAAENATLRAERDALAQRVFKLEEELALAQLHRFAPRSLHSPKGDCQEFCAGGPRTSTSF